MHVRMCTCVCVCKGACPAPIPSAEQAPVHTYNTHTHTHNNTHKSHRCPGAAGVPGRPQGELEFRLRRHSTCPGKPFQSTVWALGIVSGGPSHDPIRIFQKHERTCTAQCPKAPTRGLHNTQGNMTGNHLKLTGLGLLPDFYTKPNIRAHSAPEIL